MRSARSATPPSSQPDSGKAAAVLIQHGVGEAGGGQGVAQVVGKADGVGIAQGDGRLDGVDFVHHGQAQAGGCVAFGTADGFVFGFDHHRGAVGGGNQVVQLQAGASLDQLGILGAHLAAGEHGAQQVAQLVIGAGFAVSWALGGHG